MSEQKADLVAHLTKKLGGSPASSAQGSPLPPPRGILRPGTPSGAMLTPMDTPTGGQSPRGSPYPSKHKLQVTPATESQESSRRGSHATCDADSRRGSSIKKPGAVVKDLRKGVKTVTDSTLKAGHKVKDTTALVSAHMKVATAGASQWVAEHTSKTAKEAMEKARSGLSGGEKFTLFAFEKISKLSRKGFTHIFMLLVLMGYSALGALLFMMFEAPVELEKNEEKVELSRQRALLISAIWNESSLVPNLERFQSRVEMLMAPYEEQLFESFSTGIDSLNTTSDWTFMKSMFFCSTIITTIGYGHVAPVTRAGRALTIVYAIIGIPIFLILMADFGKLFTRILKSIFIFCGKLYRSATCRKVRKHSTTKRLRGSFSNFKNWILRRQPPPEEQEPRMKGESHLNPEELFADDNFNLPISLALFILIVYYVIGCVFYTMWEDWTYFEAFYFIFISLTTIGFGDFVPQHQAFMLLTTVYLVFGLALTAMCINVIQEKLTDTFRKASVKLKSSFGNIMAQKAEQEAIEGPKDHEIAQVHKDILEEHHEKSVV